MKLVYLAGPLGFSEAGRSFQYEKLIPILQDANLNVLDPWKLTQDSKINAVMALPYGQERRDKWTELNKEIAENNTKALDSADFVVAVLDGVDIDSGTAAEIGYAAALHKKIIGYRGDFRLSSDNEGAIINLQVEYFIRNSGGTIVHSLSDLKNLLIQ